MTTFRRLINEYMNTEEIYKLLPIHNFLYKLQVIESNNIMYLSSINFIYNKYKYTIYIHYSKNYPFRGPDKIFINNYNIFTLYDDILNNNKFIIKDEDLCYKSLLCSQNWSLNKTINDLMKEILKIIDYKQLYVKRILLKKIIEKYTDKDLNFMEQYLLN